MDKTSVKFQKDRTKPVRGVGGLRSLSYSTPHFTNGQTHFNSLSFDKRRKTIN